MERPKDYMEIHHNHTNAILDAMKKDSNIDIEKSEISKFFADKHVLITGASGFVGTLLIEKLLRSCPKINKLYLLFRAKKGKTPEERFQEHFRNAVYNRLRRDQPDYMNKVELIEGDTSLHDLGISVRDREKLIENVHIVFHGAATVRFDESLRRAVNINVRGTKLMMELAKEMKNLKAFVHVSTAFAHCVYKHIEEKYYDPPMEPDRVLEIVDMFDDDMLDHMTPKLLGKYPNTYAFTKALGEEIVKQKSAGIPTCVVRPSIMLATYKEPVPGWINNFYGATGVVAGAAYGLLHSLYCEPTNVAEIIPADYVINNIIVAAWDTAVKEETKQSAAKEEVKKDPPIYNSVTSCQNPITWQEFMDYTWLHGQDMPPISRVWHYYFVLNKHLWIHKLFVFFLHTIPGAIIDLLLILVGQKPILSKGYKKIDKFSGVISYFSNQVWKFNNDNTLALWDRTNPIDRKIFDFNLKSLDWNEYFMHEILGLRVYIGNESITNVPQAKVKARRLKIAHYTYVTLMFAFMSWLLFSFLRLFLSFFY